mmetsp:Transcript_9712/g.20086  ORF Transcript_9712/g.20086 Transcript_9712/m.20086 type:complete len:210 (-) Transcript_9712:1029-1658(-)
MGAWSCKFFRSPRNAEYGALPASLAHKRSWIACRGTCPIIIPRPPWLAVRPSTRCQFTHSMRCGLSAIMETMEADAPGCLHRGGRSRPRPHVHEPAIARETRPTATECMRDCGAARPVGSEAEALRDASGGVCPRTSTRPSRVAAEASATTSRATNPSGAGTWRLPPTPRLRSWPFARGSGGGTAAGAPGAAPTAEGAEAMDGAAPGCA